MARKTQPRVVTDPEERAEVAYVRAVAEYEDHWKREVVRLAEKIEPKQEAGEPVKQKLLNEYKDALNRADKLRQTMFRAFDNWHHMLKHTVTVPEDEIRQIVIDSLGANQDGLPMPSDWSGLDRHRFFTQLAEVIVDDMKKSRVKVREEAMADMPLCAEHAA